MNDPPLAFDDAFELAEDEQLVVAGTGVLENDYDVESTVLSGGGGTPLSAVLVDGPAHGSVVLNSDGGFTYTPDANYSGTDSFTYRAADESLQSNTATVTLTVWPMNDPLQLIVPGPQTIAEDGSITFSSAGDNAFAVNDLESPTLIVALVVQGGHPDPVDNCRAGVPLPARNEQQPDDHVLRRQSRRGQRRAGWADLHAQREL